jgi:hypothetical protein
MDKQSNKAKVLKYIARAVMSAAKSPTGRNLAGRAAMGTGAYIAEPALARATAGGAHNLPDRQRSSRVMTALLAAAVGPKAIEKGLKVPGIKRMVGPATTAMTIASPSIVGGVSHRMFGPGGVRHGGNAVGTIAAGAGTLVGDPASAKRLTSVSTDALNNVWERNKGDVKRVAGEFGKQLARTSAKHYGTAAATGLTGYALARMLLPRSEQPENRSLEEADEFYEAERRRRMLASAIGVGSAGLGIGASLLAPKLGPALGKGMAGLRQRIAPSS